MNFDDKVKLNTFCGSTTYINDYRQYPPQKRQIYKWEKQTSELLPKKCSNYVREDHETFRPWKEKMYVHFDLLWEKRPILRTNPWKQFNKNLQEPIDTGKDEAIKTRPRLYMSPAVSLDDVPDKDMRALLCKNLYITDWRRSEMEAVAYVNIMKRDTADSVLEGGGSFQLSVDQYPPLPDNWRDLYEKWDKKQKRKCVDSTKTFWLHTPLIPNENPLGKLVHPETKTKILDLIKKNRLRQPHDLYAPRYNGYKVSLPKGVSLAKNDFPVVHPDLSVAQAITKRNEGDAIAENCTCKKETT